MMKKIVCKRKNGKKESSFESGQTQAKHQIARGIKEGIVRRAVFMPNDLVARGGAANLLSLLTVFLQTLKLPLLIIE